MANNTNRKQNTNNDTNEMMAIGAGIAALAAGAYFFLGPKGKKHQKNMKGWMVKMKGDVLERLEDAKEISEPIYNEIVDTVAKTNSVAGKIPQAEILALAADLKKQWRSINRGFKSVSKKSPKAKSRNIKTASKKKPAAKKSTTAKNKSTSK